MERSTVALWPSRRIAAALAVLGMLASGRAAVGYTVASPEVRQMVTRAVGYLEKHGGQDGRLGAQALVGIVLLKEGESPGHPRIVDAVGRIQRAVNRVADPAKLRIEHEIYSVAQAVIFLSMLDPVKYGREINTLLAFLQSRQKPHGGWGYPDRETGDTSMTQNVVLCLWEATQAGIRIPTQMLDRVTIWLLRVQDPSGGFPYQGHPADGFQLIRQGDIRPSMTAAGLGSLYILADLLRLGRAGKQKQDNLPAGVRKVEKQQPTQRRSQVDPTLVRAALVRGMGWMQKNYRIDQGHSNLYHLYSLERYHSFREAAEGRREREPKWYNDGVRWLMEHQQSDGSWTSESQAVPATAFGVLFLIRSTRKSIERQRSFGDGTLIGGRGLPDDPTGLTVLEGKVVSKPKLASLDEILRALEDAESPDYADALRALAELPSDQAGDFVSRHAKKLRKLAGDTSPEARLAAVRALAKDCRLEHVPTLIYALTDPDPEIAIEARDALRRITRKFRGFGLPDYPALPADKRLREQAIKKWQAERDAAVKKWRSWYLAVRPNAEFEDEAL